LKSVSEKYQDTHIILYSFMNIYLLSYWYHPYWICFNSCKVVSIKHTDINNINIRMQIKMIYLKYRNMTYMYINKKQ
jgi:hypothetical protein